MVDDHLEYVCFPSSIYISNQLPFLSESHVIVSDPDWSGLGHGHVTV